MAIGRCLMSTRVSAHGDTAMPGGPCSRRLGRPTPPHIPIIGGGPKMPLQQHQPAYADQAFDPQLHAMGTKGRAGRCTNPNCDSPPVVSRLWSNASYPNGWRGSY